MPYDLCLSPKDARLPGILIELKAVKNGTEDELKTLSEKALTQIRDRKYDTELSVNGIDTVLKYGVAFSGKRVQITAE